MFERVVLKSTIVLGVGGSALYILGLFGYIKPFSTAAVSLLTFSPIITLWKTIGWQFSRMKRASRLVIITNYIILILYAGGIFVPDMSYDALWYHLPEAQVYTSTGLIKKIPQLLYSTMPRLGEMFFIFGYTLSSPIAVKTISFYGLLLYLALTYLIARRLLPRLYASITTLSVTSIYLLSWLGTSGYIDLFRSIFELASLYCLLNFLSTIQQFNHLSIKKWLFLSAIFSSFALSVKFHSLIHLFASAAILFHGLKRQSFSIKSSILHTSYFILLAILIASPWYINNYLESGHHLYPLNLPGKQLDQLNHAGAASMSDWLISQTLRLPLLFWHLTVYPTDFLTPLFLILLPLIIWRWKFTIKPSIPLILYILLYLLLWWFLPPPETRYLVTLFPLFLTLGFKAVHSLPKKHDDIKKIAFIFTATSILLTVFFRLYASAKWLPLLTGRITRDQYIQSQTNDFNRAIVEKYYSGYWQRYQYPRK